MRVTTLYDGTSQIWKLIIGRALTGVTRSSRREAGRAHGGKRAGWRE